MVFKIMFVSLALLGYMKWVNGSGVFVELVVELRFGVEAQFRMIEKNGMFNNGGRNGGSMGVYGFNGVIKEWRNNGMMNEFLSGLCIEGVDV